MQDGLSEKQHTKRRTGKGAIAMADNFIIIPALKPERAFLEQIRELHSRIHARIIVIDDGSGKHYRAIFDQIARIKGCIVLRHLKNLGKGQALKTGFRYVRKHGGKNSLILCTDCDGQHLPEDGKKLLKKAGQNPGSLVLGIRNFSAEGVPWKSRMGNRFTSILFRTAGRIKLSDTQTGFRAFDGRLLDQMLRIPGSRFEYEMCVLLVCAERGIPILTERIETVYINENEKTHFRSVRDSLQVIRVILSYYIYRVKGAYRRKKSNGRKGIGFYAR